MRSQCNRATHIHARTLCPNVTEFKFIGLFCNKFASIPRLTSDMVNDLFSLRISSPECENHSGAINPRHPAPVCLDSSSYGRSPRALVDSTPMETYFCLMRSATEPHRGQNGGGRSGRVRYAASGPLVQPIGPRATVPQRGATRGAVPSDGVSAARWRTFD